MRVWGKGIALATAGAALAVMLAGRGSGESEHEGPESGTGAPDPDRADGERTASGTREEGRGAKGPGLVVDEYADFGAVPAITPPPANTVATW
ncbi:hypothetical protein [Streptomyces sp. BPTC-684]|uniref:hypothetical protein n=1 Tax=Streptomyces sp. BPTC-684 TaxID=3043734 RepID=UPI0024B1FA16|nr:hypothetical protein [Streptomyces sp. BPTC-684]WHM40310.1 hypothetical protein QIY60_27945 [Streptomyces sp. BPTC-684]